MVDEIRSLPDLQALAADNSAGNISAQDLRDILVSTNARAQFDADIGPATPNAMDDGFGDVKWTQQEAGNAPTWGVGDDARWYFTAAAEANQRWKGQHQSIPAGDFDIRCKVASYTGAKANYHKPCGLYIAEGTTAQALQFVTMSLVAAPQIEEAVWSNWSTFSSTVSNFGWSPMQPLYFRITRATANYQFYVSNDGTTWVDTGAAHTLSFTPTVIGIGGTAENGSAGPVGAAFEWFRRIS